MRRLALLTLAIVSSLAAQDPDIRLTLTGRPHRPILAIPDFKGDAQSQPFMNAFDETLRNDLEGSGFFDLVPKSSIPSVVPQQLADFGTPAALQAWTAPPTKTEYIAIGYSAVQSGTFMFRGWLVDARVANLAGAQLFEKRYGEATNEDGARRAAHKYAADILVNFGIKPIFGTHIYFERESSRPPRRRTEIWMMDADGSHQKQLTHLDSSSTQPAVSPDGKTLAFVSYAPFPGIVRYSLEFLRALPFANLHDPASVATPAFSADGTQILYSVRTGDRCCQVVTANLDGSNRRTITNSDSINGGAQVNPKTGAQIAFVSGRSGHAQVYVMNSDGTAVERVSDGLGEAVHPVWSPDGRFLVYASTHGYGSGGWNIFWKEPAGQKPQQVTHDEGKNEYPCWAPDGLHIVFQSNRSGRSQIWSVLADGTQLRQLTTEGSNSSPAWGN